VDLETCSLAWPCDVRVRVLGLQVEQVEVDTWRCVLVDLGTVRRNRACEGVLCVT
jgi:hypothetical protein